MMFAGGGKTGAAGTAAGLLFLADRQMANTLVMRFTALRCVAVKVCAAGPATERWKSLATDVAGSFPGGVMFTGIHLYSCLPCMVL
jgi:hypothetical protein